MEAVFIVVLAFALGFGGLIAGQSKFHLWPVIVCAGLAVCAAIALLAKGPVRIVGALGCVGIGIVTSLVMRVQRVRPN